MRQSHSQGGAQLGLLRGAHHQAGYGQLNVVLFKAVNTRKTVGGQKVAIHPQMGKAPGAGPIGQLGVDTLAPLHQGCQQANVLATVGFEQLGRNAVGGLRLHRRTIVHAVLGAQLHIQEPQEVPHLGGGAHGALAPAAA